MEIIVFKKLLMFILKVVSSSFLLLLFIYFQHFYPIGANISNGVTQKNLLLLKSNMNEKKIIEILGEPLSKEYTKKYFGKIDYFLVYAKQGIFSIGGLGMSIGIKNKKLVYLEVIDSYDDGIYACDEKVCPFFIDKEKFDILVPGNKGDRQDFHAFPLSTPKPKPTIITHVSSTKLYSKI